MLQALHDDLRQVRDPTAFAAVWARHADAARAESAAVVTKLMAFARWRNEDNDDPFTAAVAWSAAHGLAAPDARGPIGPIMLQVAGRRARGGDPDGALAIYLAAHAADPALGVIRKLMSAANDVSQVGQAVDLDLAVFWWRAAVALAPADTARIARTAMLVANKSIDLGDLAGAAGMWRFVTDVAGDTRAWGSALAVAARADAVADAIAVWDVAWSLHDDAEHHHQIVLEVMARANRATPFDGPVDASGAVALWGAVVAWAPDEAPRVARTAWGVANHLARPGATVDALAAAITIWGFVGRITTDARRLRRSALDVGASDPTLADALAAASVGAVGVDPELAAEWRVGWTQAAGDHSRVLELTDGAAAPALRALRAEALRKLQRYDEAEALSVALVAELTGDPRVAAAINLAYVGLERAKAAGDGEAAVAAFTAARGVIEAEAVEAPPRFWTGIGYAYRLARREADALAAFRRAAEVDADNRKAREALAVEDGGAPWA